MKMEKKIVRRKEVHWTAIKSMKTPLVSSCVFGQKTAKRCVYTHWLCTGRRTCWIKITVLLKKLWNKWQLRTQRSSIHMLPIWQQLRDLRGCIKVLHCPRPRWGLVTADEAVQRTLIIICTHRLIHQSPDVMVIVGVMSPKTQGIKTLSSKQISLDLKIRSLRKRTQATPHPPKGSRQIEVFRMNV